MTVERAFPDCPECGGCGWGYGAGQYPDTPEQIICVRCQGTGTIDPADKPDNSEPMGEEWGL
jgi:hypothetical protein